MPIARDPVCFNAGALFRHLEELDAEFDPALPRHWSFSFRHADFDALAEAADGLLAAMVAALGREPAELAPQLSRGRIELDAQFRQRRGSPAAELEFVDVLAEAELGSLHAAFEAFAAGHELAYEGVHSYDALPDDDLPMAEGSLDDIAFEPVRKQPAGKRTVKPAAKKPGKKALKKSDAKPTKKPRPS